ncbi:MAG: molybdenum cofactor biosynthesis protein, partial [Pseudomonadales bacterium]
MATEFLPLHVAVLTLSDTRTLAEDRSGAYLESALLEAGHTLAARSLCADDRYAMRARVSAW